MMTSPARRHFHRETARLVAGKSEAGAPMAGSAYDMMLLQLANDRGRLKSIASIHRKREVKRDELLPAYVEYVDGALSGGRGAQDDVLTTIMIWRIDAGDYAGALDIARYAVAHRMTLPDQYDRKLAAAIAEEFAEAALAAFKQEGEPPVTRAQLVEIAQLTDTHDMHDQVRAKLLKATGYAAEREGDIAAALEYLRRALELDSKAGVKQDITRLEKTANAGGGNAGRT